MSFTGAPDGSYGHRMRRGRTKVNIQGASLLEENMKSLFLTVIILTVAICSVSAQKNPSPPAGWKLINQCGAEFYLPPDFKEEMIQGIDSCVKKYRGENTLMVLDVLGYITPDASRKEEYSEKPDFRHESTKVGGRGAEIITCYETDSRKEAEGLNYAAVLFVPQMSRYGGNLTIWTNSRSREEREHAMRIFRTVRFPKGYRRA